MRSNDRGYTALFSARFDAGANLQNRHRNPMVPVYRSKRLELRLSDAALLSIVVATPPVVVVVAAFAAAVAVVIVVVASAVAPPVVPLAAVEG